LATRLDEMLDLEGSGLILATVGVTGKVFTGT